ncbi:hypothetical protein [Nocardioides sp. 1609]|uniref:hypothetical protein n=1 Tax=Nocardioides sp. 1609 TaxID=2508327 RepID=UPI00106FF15F|nr:hypothetical protein [Nocardioides sp. 1609]
MNKTPRNINQNWFHLTYSRSAPIGLPQIFQAERVMRYCDETGTWIIALWERADAAADSAAGAIANCILRLPAEQVTDVTQHRSLSEAGKAFRSVTETTS